MSKTKFTVQGMPPNVGQRDSTPFRGIFWISATHKVLLPFLSKTGTLLLLGIVAWFGWRNLGPQQPVADPARRNLANKLVPVVVEDIRTARHGIRHAAILHFENDPTDYFTDRLRTVIEERGVFDLAQRTLIEKGRDSLGLRHKSYGSLDVAVARGRKLGVDAVLFGVIKSFESYPQGAMLDIEVFLVEIDSGSVILSKNYNESDAAGILSTSLASSSLSRIPWAQKLFAWLVIMLLLPVFSMGFIRSMLRKQSNSANAFVLGVYTIIDALIALMLIGRVPNSFLFVMAFLAVVGGAFIYNLQIIIFAAHLEE